MSDCTCVRRYGPIGQGHHWECPAYPSYPSPSTASDRRPCLDCTWSDCPPCVRGVHQPSSFVVMTPTTVQPVPNTPGTPRRTIRVPDDLWNAAQAKAEEQGTDVSAVIRKALERFVRRK